MFVQEEYKDGANGSWDLQMVLALFPILRIFIVCVFITQVTIHWSLMCHLTAFSTK